MIFEQQNVLPLVAIGLIAAAHIGSVPLIRKIPETARWISDYSSGIGLGYVFLYLLPKMGDSTWYLAARSPESSEFLSYRLYLYMFFGFVCYYLIDFENSEGRDRTRRLALNIAAFALYNGLIAIALLHLNRGHFVAYPIIAFAFGLHLFGVNYLLYKWHGDTISMWMRWVFVAALALGSIVGVSLKNGDHLVSVATALVGGVIIVMSIRIKLPAANLIGKRPFLLGAGTMVLLAFLARSIIKL